MAYLFRQKLDLRGLAGRDVLPKLVIVAEAEEYLSALYSYYLHNHNFEVLRCRQPKQLAGLMEHYPPHLLIFNPRFYGDISATVKFLGSVRKVYPLLPVVTVGSGISSQELGQLMACGIMSHIDRRLSRPSDIVIIAKTLLNNS